MRRPLHHQNAILYSIARRRHGHRWSRFHVSFFKRKSSNASKNAKHSHASPTPEPAAWNNPLQWYASKLDSHPLTTKCISSGIIAGSGDVLCQYLNSRKDRQAKETFAQSTQPSHSTQPTQSTQSTTAIFDWTRTLRFTTLGSFLVAPTVHAWYGFLMTRIPGTTVSTVVRRLFFDQGVFAPLFLPTFVSFLTVLEHISPDSNYRSELHGKHDSNNSHNLQDAKHHGLFQHIQTRLRNDVPDALLVGWTIWIPSMGFMFAFVPSKFQVLFSNCVGFVWNAYLSWRTHEGEEENML